MTMPALNNACDELERLLADAKTSPDRAGVGTLINSKAREVQASIAASGLPKSDPTVRRFRNIVARVLVEVFEFDEEEAEIILRGADRPKPPTAPKPPPPPR